MNSQGTLLEGAGPDQLQTRRRQGFCLSSSVLDVNPSSVVSALPSQMDIGGAAAVTHHHLGVYPICSAPSALSPGGVDQAVGQLLLPAGRPGLSSHLLGAWGG